jgi:hypothetical protein
MKGNLFVEAQDVETPAGAVPALHVQKILVPIDFSAPCNKAFNPGEGWSFAAPESIYAKIVEHLPPKILELVVEHVESDLVKLPAAALTSHFRSVQPVQTL